MNRTAKIAISIFFALALGACGNGAGNNASNQGDGNAEQNAGSTTVDAQAIYTKSCVACHGNQLEGKSGPSLQKVGSKLSMEQIAAKIQNGGGGMPAFKSQLKDTEINGLAAWLETKK
jgi:cytochrome c551